MLKQHTFYVYYDGPVVYARAGNKERVVVKECASVQEAHDEVQKVVNPDGLHHAHQTLSKPDEFGATGFHHKHFQSKISPNCEAVVRAAYEKAGVTL